MMLLGLGAVGLFLLALLLVVLPWIRNKNRAEQDTLTNAQLVKQRLQELEREVSEGLLTENDKNIAVKELKLALLDENSVTATPSQGVKLALIVGALVTLVSGATVYYFSNQINQIQQWDAALARLPELGRRVVIEGDQSIQKQDLEDFALGIRTKLIQQPDDPTGWLLLGRLHASLNRLDSAFQAYEKALQLQPDNTGALTSYSQALLMTGQEQYIQQAQQLLTRLVRLLPDDKNTIGMLAITATQLGNIELAQKSWKKLKEILPKTDPMQVEIDNRLAQLSGGAVSSTSITVTVEISEELRSKLPTDGFLFVFAQDASGAVRMPAAVVKSKLAQFPVVIELSDQNAMMPTYTLANLNETKLVARISQDENVATSEGELQGDIVIDLQQGVATKQRILIDKELM